MATRGLSLLVPGHLERRDLRRLEDYLQLLRVYQGEAVQSLAGPRPGQHATEVAPGFTSVMSIEMIPTRVELESAHPLLARLQQEYRPA